ncbi:type IV pilus assembly protein PilM [Thioflavicoccus mobilis 8321]|uniref:Type IV pilus assembly protein PilM n=1 Tax=Thioflavicoccus mobilis 8321 TaxID=765912 RepID=L0GQB8_9GAMM|nr:type IV pilus assembly protein PilM [Thioflavicoccus mobilis]AGA88958.1 type IV pilus assembly protein PilM [Thioflavicoccus mobilis 8321]
MRISDLKTFGLGRKPSPMLGIDVGSTAVKLVELSQLSGEAARYQIERYAVEPLPPTAMSEKKIADVEAVGQGIARAVERSGAKSSRAAVAIAGSAVITKVIAMSSALSESEMEGQLQLDADQYIPFPLEEVNIDFDVLGPSASQGMVDVLLAASRRENVEDRVAALDVAGLKAEIVDVEAYAIENACALMLGSGAKGASEQVVAVADIGSMTTTLHVLHKGQVVYTREQKFGALQLINEIQQRLGMPRDEATAKVVANDLPGGYQTEIIGPFKEAVAQQIGRALQFFYSATSYNQADRIVLIGAAASLPKLDRLVEERLGIVSKVGNPFEQIAIPKNIPVAALNRDAPALVLAVGLALRGFI